MWITAVDTTKDDHDEYKLMCMSINASHKSVTHYMSVAEWWDFCLQEDADDTDSHRDPSVVDLTDEPDDRKADVHSVPPRTYSGPSYEGTRSACTALASSQSVLRRHVIVDR